MLKVESKTGKISDSDEHIYNFLADFSNFNSLVSQDRMKNWKATADTCSFTLDGLGDIGMKIIEREPYKLIEVAGDETSKFSYFFWIQLKKMDEMDTSVKLTIHADINPLVQMMAKKPLQKFLDLLIEQLENHFGPQASKNKQAGKIL